MTPPQIGGDGHAAVAGTADNPWVTARPTDPTIRGNYITPLLSGDILETVPRQLCNAQQAPTDGTPHLDLVYLEGGSTITTISRWSGTTAGVALLNQWFGLWDAGLNTLRLTADDTSTAWAASTRKTLTLSAPYVVPYSGYFYVGTVIHVTTTIPTLIGQVGLGGATIVSSGRALAGDSATVGLTTPASCPATLGALAGNPQPMYASLGGTPTP